MGYLREKYTKEYYLNKDENGNDVNYGATGAKEWASGGIFHEISNAIDLVELAGKRVLEIGYGRGESARYMLESKKVAYYEGIDFSPAAYELAVATVQNCNSSKYRLFVNDIINHMDSQKYDQRFDVVFMLDVIEHIPRNELVVLMPMIYTSLTYRGYLVVDTPFYSIDEDYILQGEKYICPSPSDTHPKTVGMHCNKYTKNGLFAEIGRYGFHISSHNVFQKKPLKFFWQFSNLLRYRRRKIQAV